VRKAAGAEATAVVLRRRDVSPRGLRALCPKSRNQIRTGGSGTGHRAVSGASESAWSASTRRSQATLRSPEVLARCEERPEWRAAAAQAVPRGGAHDRLGVDAVARATAGRAGPRLERSELNTASQDVPAGTRCRRIESIRASHRAERGQVPSGRGAVEVSRRRHGHSSRSSTGLRHGHRGAAARART